MTKDYYYFVNGTEIHDTQPFGDGWHKAKAMAEAEHSTIERAVVYGAFIRYEFYCKGGCFLDEKYRTATNARFF